MAPESSLPASSVHVPKPAADEALNIASVPGGTLAFDFDPATATASRSGNDLIFAVDGGGTVTFTDFFVVGDEALPSLVMPDGLEVAAADYLASFDMDLSTAAGPAAGPGSPSSGSGEYGDDAGNLLAGVTRIGALGTDQWGRGTEVAENVNGLATGAVAPAGLPGEPEPGPSADPYLQPLDNVNSMTAVPGDPISGDPKETDFGQGEGWTGWAVINDGGPVDSNAKEGEMGMFSQREFVTQLAKDCNADKAELVETIQRLLPDGDSWNANSSGNALTTSVDLDADGSITFNWRYDSHNSGNDEGHDAAFCILLNDAGEIVWSGLIAQFDDRTTQEEMSGSFSVPLTAGNYTLVIGELDVNGEGQKSLFFVSDVKKVEHTEIPTWKTEASGNVISDATYGTDHEGVDHIVNTDGGKTALSDDAFVTQWSFIDPFTGDRITSPEFTDGTGEFVYRTENEDGTQSYTITLKSDGTYEFSLDSVGADSPSIDDFNITYWAKDGDFEPESATLYLRTDDHVFTADNANELGQIIGSGGNDILLAGDEGGVLFGGLGNDVLYGGPGNDEMHGGGGNDIFVWSADHSAQAGALDKVMDFTLGEDMLRLDGFFGSGQNEPTMDDILARIGDDSLDISVSDANHATVTVGEQTIEVTLQGQGFDSYATDSAADKAALLAQLLSFSGG